MQKLNLKLITKFKELKCSETEINIINLITRYQDERGRLENFTCKFVLDNLSITKQHFYKSFWKLVDKQLLIVEPTCKSGCFDIQITLNDYFIYPGTDEKQFYKENPYLNTNTFNILYSNFFKKASRNLMYLILNLLKLLSQNTKVRSRKLSTESLKKYADINSKRTLKSYLDHIQSYFFVSKNSNNETYAIGIKKVKNDKFSENRNRVFYRLRSWLDKYKITYNSWQLTNTADLFIVNKYEEKFPSLLHNVLINTCFSHNMLKPRLINRTVSIKASDNKLYLRDELKGNQGNAKTLDNSNAIKEYTNTLISDTSRNIEDTLVDLLGTGNLLKFLNGHAHNLSLI